MAIRVLSIGKTSTSYLTEGMGMYLKRLNKYGGINWTELPDIRKNKFSTDMELKALEADAFLKEIGTTDFVIGLDEKGKSYTSRAFAGKMNDWMVGNSNLVFVIGGAFGFDHKLYERMNTKISMSEMTYSHQLVRLLFLEQLYRAFTILKGEPYHND
ncbi:MAG: 23S rRNA (pseudouridine(1915)-N(3))-methyltransferase RlmH [Flavobacteriales bacterium]|nr:23S rRNA (pseudouridine(1915)-N(3))-methyltransferase RlmH [Bacteroidota bacterium]MCB9239946.1 23S rRNA (pseudouridine(1915)-N(3))-methyltransferase RlmH [Flavobacteriales bacterium]